MCLWRLSCLVYYFSAEFRGTPFFFSFSFFSFSFFSTKKLNGCLEISSAVIEINFIFIFIFYQYHNPRFLHSTTGGRARKSENFPTSVMMLAVMRVRWQNSGKPSMAATPCGSTLSVSVTCYRWLGPRSTRLTSLHHNRDGSVLARSWRCCERGQCWSLRRITCFYLTLFSFLFSFLFFVFCSRYQNFNISNTCRTCGQQHKIVDGK